jgi:glycerol uptake facilitator-like aquaporin
MCAARFFRGNRCCGSLVLDLFETRGEGRSSPAALPGVPSILAQLLQDFGAGAVLPGPVLHTFNNINADRHLPSVYVFMTGAILFAAGWRVRQFTKSSSSSSQADGVRAAAWAVLYHLNGRR